MQRIVMTLALMGLLVVMVIGCDQSDSAEVADDAVANETTTEVTQDASANEPTTEVTPDASAKLAIPEVAISTQPKAPSISAPDLDGVSHDVSEWLGQQPLVVNFWGTWCGPCRREIPDLVRLYDEYKGQGVEIISLAVNDTPEKVRAYANQANMAWVMLLGDREQARFFRLTGAVPTTIFYDRNGNEVQRFVGATSYEVFKPAFDAIL